MRKIITKGLYLLFVELVATYLIVFPVYAFNVSQSATGYVRVATSTALTVYQGTQRAVFTNAVATAMASATPVSVAVRIATGPVGWTALGVSAALTLAGMYYSQSQVAATKTAALNAQPPTITIPSYATPAGSTVATNGCIPLVTSCVILIDMPNAANNAQCLSISPLWPQRTPPSGWSNTGVMWWTPTSTCIDRMRWQYNGSNAATQPMIAAPTSLSVSQYQSFLNGLLSANANSIESNTSPLGQGATVPTADNVTTLPVTPAQVVPTVKPAASVLPTDSVIDPNAPAPSGPQVVATPATSTTKTTTSITNPDGSVTQTETAPASTASCNVGNHDVRTFGSVLQDHMNVWQGSGLLSALNVLKTLTWPTTPPTYTLTSSTWGTHTIDFAPWSGMLTALRTIIIALASFVAYRIVFVGSK